ncbi:UDP-N-acetylmuramate--L-alanine ligase [Neptunitalea lumnitzerae]|uniref:UDP-N-acetylmuramate--L-alanine ligase n=1 Tax=Neptunitalea lumnitzerae TaxID=2965509 RepID=A0ABQ5MJ64_9FLAO|nr:UDP-N-acetylmuramate--L-alanine ligase [Neptunitalea sp. Y10]GLB49100.1 UDP-N-acetylmuramate--L-alanine ligase [Neptunitalea sp. Y10]
MNLAGIHNVYFVGIGGIGMSNLARYFFLNGKNVAGYDKTPSDITDALQELGVTICFSDAMTEVSAEFLDAATTLVVYTPAVPQSHEQLQYFLKHNFEVKKRAAVLGAITKDTFCFAVAGTHGKTTTTAILGHLLKESGVPMTAFLGGISENYNTNFISTGTEMSVVEADEYDRSFLNLHPDVACITSMEADHLDIYENEEGIVTSFKDFVAQLKPNGKLYIKNGVPLQGITYGIEDDSDYCIKNITIENGTYCFDVATPTNTIEGVQFNKPGKHNLLNALAAFTMAINSGTPTDRLVSALSTFKGVRRRFSYHIQTEELVFVDDYAHHPTEIDALHQAVREMYPDKKVTAVFQPHLYSRTRDFAKAFGSALAQFDEIILLDIYPARELPIEGVTSEWLLSLIDNTAKKLMSKEALLAYLKVNKPEVLITVGAGDIGNEVAKIKEVLLA